MPAQQSSETPAEDNARARRARPIIAKYRGVIAARGGGAGACIFILYRYKREMEYYAARKNIRICVERQTYRGLGKRKKLIYIRTGRTKENNDHFRFALPTRRMYIHLYASVCVCMLCAYNAKERGESPGALHLNYYNEVARLRARRLYSVSLSLSLLLPLLMFI